jgi:hypothetical protein
MMEFVKRSFWEGVFIMGLGAGILALSPSQIKGIPGLMTEMSPAFIPTFVGVTLIFLGAILTLGTFIGKTQEKTSDFVWKQFVRVIISFLLLVSYAFFFPIIGFLTTSVLYIGIFAFIFGQRNIGKLAALMLVVPALVWILFEIIFVIPIPHGLLF